MLGYPDQALRSIHEGSHLPASWLTPPAWLWLCAGWQRSSNLARRNKQPEEGAEACAALAGEQGFAPESAQDDRSCGAGHSSNGDGARRSCPDTAGSGGLPGHRISTETVVLSCPARRGVWQGGAGRGRVEGPCRGAGGAPNWGEEVAARPNSTGSRVVQSSVGWSSLYFVFARSRGVLPAGPRHGPAPAGQVVGAAGRDESEPAVAQQGKRQEAYDLLAPIYHWFTEGFDTADLQEASPCCSVTWWTRPCSPASSTRKSCARWCGPIKTPAPR